MFKGQALEQMVDIYTNQENMPYINSIDFSKPTPFHLSY